MESFEVNTFCSIKNNATVLLADNITIWPRSCHKETDRNMIFTIKSRFPYLNRRIKIYNSAIGEVKVWLHDIYIFKSIEKGVDQYG